jgi:hypothetical protein
MTYRTLFEATIGPEPAARHTVDELMAGYRRRALVRRLAAGGAGAAVLLVVGAAALVAPGPQPSPGRPSVAAPPPSETVAATGRADATPSPMGSEPLEAPQHAAARLAGAIEAAVRLAMPTLRLDGPFVVERREQPGVPESIVYEAEQTFHAGSVTGTLTIGVRRRVADTTCTPTTTPPSLGDPTGFGPHVRCDEIGGGPGQDRVVFTLITGEAPELVRAYVAVDRLDGTTTTAGVEYTGRAEPVSRSQLQVVATDYRVTFYP